MPKSKKRRRKDGKKLGNGLERRRIVHNQRLERAGDIESKISMQDLIDLVAYQEYVKDGTIVDDNVIVNVPGELPVYSGEGENRKQIGTATPIPDDPEGNLSIRITDPEAIELEILGKGQYSIGNPEVENE